MRLADFIVFSLNGFMPGCCQLSKLGLRNSTLTGVPSGTSGRDRDTGKTLY